MKPQRSSKQLTAFSSSESVFDAKETTAAPAATDDTVVEQKVVLIKEEVETTEEEEEDDQEAANQPLLREEGTKICSFLWFYLFHELKLRSRSLYRL